MRGAQRVTSVTSSLSVKLFGVLALAILTVFVVYAAATGGAQRRILEDQVKADAYVAGDFIRQSLLTSMLRNERADINAIIAQIGAEPRVQAIRIYNKLGEITFSNDPAEVGRAVDLEAEACYACHATSEPLAAVPTTELARIYRSATDGRVLALINPIENAEGCWNAQCHAHDAEQSVLGVLDVQMSMASADAAMADASRRAIGYAAAAVVVWLGLIGAIVYRGVHRPAAQLRRGTEALAAGDLNVTLDINRADELGALAVSFNRMAGSLRAADQELRRWAQALEERVRAKTAELEAMSKHMIRAEKAVSLGRMAATVAHELNNPLSGIVTYAKLIERRGRELLPDGQRRARLLEHAELIRSESLRCGNIVRDLLTYARQGNDSFRPARLHELIGRALRLVGHHIALGQIVAETELQLENDVIVCDAEQIEQALVALLINAVEAMPEGGRITITTFEIDRGEPGHVVVRVADSGVGIPLDARDHIFDPFFSTKSDVKGVGLGLAVVYGIVQRHGGDIRVMSRPGEGATFTIDLPRVPDAAGHEHTLARAVGVSVS